MSNQYNHLNYEHFSCRISHHQRAAEEVVLFKVHWFSMISLQNDFFLIHCSERLQIMYFCFCLISIFLFGDFNLVIFTLKNLCFMIVNFRFIRNLVFILVFMIKDFGQFFLWIVKNLLNCRYFFEFEHIRIIEKIIFAIFYQTKTNQLYQVFLWKDRIRFLFNTELNKFQWNP